MPRKHGAEATFADASDPDAVAARLRPNTRLVRVETIRNPTTKVTDIAAVIGRRELIGGIKAYAMVDVGGMVSPFNAWLITRGSVTLPLRLSRYLESAQLVVEFLAADPRVAFVAYPGLPSHPQHELAEGQFGSRGYGAALSFTLHGTPEMQNRFVAALQVVTSAVFLGHEESLIVHVGTEGPRVAAYPEPFRRSGHLRLSAGLEGPRDLITDLTAALDEATR